MIGAVRSSLENPEIPETISLEHLLTISGVSEEEYVTALKQSRSSLGIVHAREQSDIMVNNYKPTILQALQANMDLQYATDTYACIAYVASYVGKDKTNLSQLLHAASKEAHESDVRRKYISQKQGGVCSGSGISHSFIAFPQDQ